MKATTKSRLKRLENKISNCSAKQPLSVCYIEKRDLLIITYINVKVNTYFKWNGISLWLPDNGRRRTENDIFILTETYLNSQPEVAAILKGYAEEKSKKLALNFDPRQLNSYES